MKRQGIDFNIKKVVIKIERQAIGDEELFHIETNPMIWGLTETFDNAAEAAVHLAGYIEDTILSMAHNNANAICFKCSWR